MTDFVQSRLFLFISERSDLGPLAISRGRPWLHGCTASTDSDFASLEKRLAPSATMDWRSLRLPMVAQVGEDFDDPKMLLDDDMPIELPESLHGGELFSPPLTLRRVSSDVDARGVNHFQPSSRRASHSSSPKLPAVAEDPPSPPALPTGCGYSEHMEVARMILELEPASVPSLASLPPSVHEVAHTEEVVVETVHASADAVVNDAIAHIAAVRNMLLQLEPKAYEQNAALFEAVRAVDSLDRQLNIGAGVLRRCAVRHP